MNFREASYSHGVAATVSFRWSRSSGIIYSQVHWITFPDGSRDGHSGLYSQDSNGVAMIT